jgi:hypothetical protein
MLAAIRQWVIRTMMKNNTGVVQTLPRREIIELNTQITAQRLMQNGVDPSALKNADQVENVVNQIEKPKVIPADSAAGKGITEQLLGKKKAEVFDLEGNKISEGSKIIGGKQIKPIDELENFNVDKEPISEKFINFTIQDINKKEPLEGMKIANKIIKREGEFKDLTEAQSQRILKETNDHLTGKDVDYDPEDFYNKGGRVGLKGGTFLNFLKKFKVKKSGDDLKDFLSKRQFMKDIVGNTEKNRKARQLAELKEAMEETRKNPGFEFPSGEELRVDIEKEIAPILLKDRKLNATGGRVGLNKGGGLLKLLNFFNKKSPVQAGKDYLQNVKAKTLKANETGKFTDLPLAEVGIPAASGALVNNQMRKKLKAMNEEQKEENLKEFIKELENDEFYQKYPEIKDETIANYTEKLFGEKRAAGGRIGYKDGPELKLYPRASGLQKEQEVGPGIKISERDVNYGITGLLEGDKFFGGAEIDKGKVKIDVVTPEGDTLFKDSIGKEDAVNFILGMGDPQGEKFQIKTDKDFENIQVVLRKSFANGGRIGLAGGMTKRAFLKLMGMTGAGVAALKSGIIGLGGKQAGKEVAKEVVKSTTTPPPYFFKLAEKIKMMGDDVTATTDRTIAKKLPSKDGKSEYLLEQDVSTGDTIIKKINKEGDDMVTNIEIMQHNKGQADELTKGKKPADSYEEVTEYNSRIYKDNFNDPDYADGINVDDIIKEIDDQAPSIKKAGGGIARMLGE